MVTCTKLKIQPSELHIQTGQPGVLTSARHLHGAAGYPGGRGQPGSRQGLASVSRSVGDGRGFNWTKCRPGHRAELDVGAGRVVGRRPGAVAQTGTTAVVSTRFSSSDSNCRLEILTGGRVVLAESSRLQEG